MLWPERRVVEGKAADVRRFVAGWVVANQEVFLWNAIKTMRDVCLARNLESEAGIEVGVSEDDDKFVSS